MTRLLPLGALLGLAIAACSGCGGSSSTSPAATLTEPTGPRPVRVDDPERASDEASGARPVRVAPSVPGEVAESDELAAPPPIEAPAP